MTLVQELARFVVERSFLDLSENARRDLAIRVLDSLGCAIGAIGAAPVRAVRALVEELGGSPRSTLLGGGRTSPDRAALYNGACVRYLDFNDSYLAPGETCHPSDNLAPVLAAAEYAKRSGRDLLTALAIAYQVQCRLSDVAPVRDKGFDHTTQGAYAVAAGVSKALGLDAGRTANAIAVAGTALNALRVTRTGALSSWKALAYPHTAFAATHAALLAKHGVTGPAEVLEGNKGFMDAIAGPFEIDWSREDLERVTRTILKKHNAEIHSQTAIEAVLDLREEAKLRPSDVDRIEVEIFDVAHRIIGGGEEGAKTDVRTKEQADHSLPYLVAVALLDGQVMPEQYEASRILSGDVQSLLRRVHVRPRDDYSRRFPREVPCRVVMRLRDGRQLERERSDYEGFATKPMSWEAVARKFDRLTAGRIEPEARDRLLGTVKDLDAVDSAELARALGSLGREEPS